MTLKQKLDDEELALLEIVQDPIWFGEFMRSTADGETDENVYPPEQWKYRDYQRQFLSDQSEFILYTGGRAIGKCQPSGSRIYTTKGYKKISELAREKSFIVYAFDPKTLELEQKRAVIVADKVTDAYTIVTESGHEFVSTELHPILTPDGFRLMADLKEGDHVAVATKLPHESTNNGLAWHELRFLGYTILLPGFLSNHSFKPRFKSIGTEIEAIANRFICRWHKDFNGNYSFPQKKGPYKHPIKSLQTQIDLYNNARQTHTEHSKSIPNMLKEERLDNISIFLEALFAQFADLSSKEINVKSKSRYILVDIQELLLRFGIESRVNALDNLDEGYILKLLDYRAVYRFWKTFKLPGVSIGTLPLPPHTNDPSPFMRFDKIVLKYRSHTYTNTYGVHVYDYNNYIGDNVFVHNTVVLEDKMVWDIINSQTEFTTTPEMALVTSNQAQMTPLQNRLILRFSASKFLKDYLRGNINKSTGIMQFPRKGKPFILTMRIAGSRGENNMVGLHIPKIVGDEAQLFPLPAFTQLQPCYNGWEKKRQQVWAGVPNGLRNSVLYMLDQQTPRYKKYRIPAPNNVVGYTYEMYIEDLRRYGGQQDDRFQQLVLGRHGSAAFQVIPRESITIETYAFYNQRYNSAQVLKGQRYDEVLTRPSLPHEVTRLVLAIDPGFVDPTLIQLIGCDKKGIWRVYIRYRLTRIDFNEQQKIIDWLATYYQVQQIAMDIGAGGNGAAMMHNLINGDQYKNKNYNTRILGIQFKENILAGYDDDGEELFQEAKSFAATELAKIIQDGRLIFSEIDNEGLSQMERIAKKKSFAGRDSYFVLSDKGNGVDEDDHIFSSFLCFVLGIRNDPLNPNMKKLGKATGSHTN